MANDLQAKDKEQVNAKVLNIKMQKEITSFLFSALPLCIILSEKNLIPWFNEHFIEIFMRFDGNELYFGYNDTCSYGEKDFDCNNTLFSLNSISFERMIENNTDIIGLIEESIDSGSYLMIFTDEFYLPQKESYQKQHFVHESMIYGYDKDKKTLNAVAFNRANVFTEIKYSYDDFAKAFNEGKKYYKDRYIKWIEEKAVSQIKLKEFLYPYPFDISRFIKRIENYVDSKVDSEKEYYLRFYEQDANMRYTYGINTYDAFTSFLGDLIKGDIQKLQYFPWDLYFFQYVIICAHFLYEHKKLMSQRFKYVIEEFETSSRFSELTNKYNDVIKAINLIKSELFKMAMMGRTVNHDAIKGISDKIMTVKQTELNLLKEILIELREIKS